MYNRCNLKPYSKESSMRYWECVLDTPTEEIDARCDELSDLGVGGFVVENEED